MLDQLGRGGSAAESIGSLAERLQRPRRAVERELEELVHSGVPVVANERGVYLAETAQEARQYAESLRGRIAAVQSRITALERWADEHEQTGQTELWAA